MLISLHEAIAANDEAEQKLIAEKANGGWQGLGVGLGLLNQTVTKKKLRSHRELSDCSSDQLSDIFAARSPGASFIGSQRGSQAGSISTRVSLQEVDRNVVKPSTGLDKVPVKIQTADDANLSDTDHAESSPTEFKVQFPNKTVMQSFELDKELVWGA